MSPAVLVVDDDRHIRELLVDALLGEGYRAIAASNGQEALDAVAREIPEVILLDLMMPVMDGWTFAARYHEQRGTADVPIVVLSASRDLPDTAVGLQAHGVRACLAKPFDLDAVLGLVERYARPTDA